METRLLKRYMTAAYQYSHVRLTLNYTTFYDRLRDTTGLKDKAEGCIRRFNTLLTRHYGGGKIHTELLELRRDITAEVDILIAYADCLQIYEYVLNRLERKFKTLTAVGVSDKRFVNHLMTYISKSKESAVMNSRIQEVIGQLPVRMTRQKFFSLVTEGLSVYIGSPAENLKDMMYRLETESMTKLPADMDSHKEHYELLQDLSKLNYRSLSLEIYEDACWKLNLAAEALKEESGIYMDLQSLVNDLCVLELAGMDAVMDVREEELFKSLNSEILKRFQKGLEPLDHKFYEQFVQLEGRQEAYYDKYLRCELSKADEELERDADYTRAVNIDRLLSGSSFAELKEASGGQVECHEAAIADQGFFENTVNGYFERLEQIFSKASRPVVRAIMAKVLSNLPVYFNSLAEIEGYVRGSLESCMDEAEKETCKELLEELMNDETDLV